MKAIRMDAPPLHYAVAYNHADIAAELISSGASPGSPGEASHIARVSVQFYKRAVKHQVGDPTLGWAVDIPPEAA